MLAVSNIKTSYRARSFKSIKWFFLRPLSIWPSVFYWRVFPSPQHQKDEGLHGTRSSSVASVAHATHKTLRSMWHWQGGVGNPSQKQRQNPASGCHISLPNRRWRHLTKSSPTPRGFPGHGTKSEQASEKQLFLVKQFYWKTSVPHIFV